MRYRYASYLGGQWATGRRNACMSMRQEMHAYAYADSMPMRIRYRYASYLGAHSATARRNAGAYCLQTAAIRAEVAPAPLS